MPLDLILDSDIGTDVDDALALAFALRHPDIRLRAVTTVSGDTARRAQIASKLLRLAGRDDVEVAAGLSPPVPPPDSRSAWLGHEGDGLLDPDEKLRPSRRDAVALLLDAATRWDGVQVATIGMQTNVAAALNRDGGWGQRVARLAVMGGVFSPGRPGGRTFLPSRDHNLNVDRDSAVRVLNAGIPILYVPGDVTVETALTTGQVERLRRGDALCRALAALVDRWAPVFHELSPGMPDEQVAFLHDPLTVASMIDRRFVSVEQMPVTVAVHDGVVRTFVDPVAGRVAEVVTSVAADDFSDFWLQTVAG